MSAQTIGLISALPQELEALTKAIEGHRTVVHGSDEFVVGHVNGLNVVATLSGMGKVNAASTAQKLISEFKTKVLIFTGVAGGINDGHEIGDIIIAKETFQHDFGYFGDEFVARAIGTMPEVGMGSGAEPLIQKLDAWPAMPDSGNFFEQVTMFLRSQASALSQVTVDDREYAPKISVGVIATGDQFIANSAKRKFLSAHQADAVEMEGAAVAYVAARNGVHCLILRSISDKASHHAKLDFQKFFSTVAKNNALLVVDVLRNEKFAEYFSALA